MSENIVYTEVTRQIKTHSDQTDAVHNTVKAAWYYVSRVAGTG